MNNSAPWEHMYLIFCLSCVNFFHLFFYFMCSSVFFVIFITLIKFLLLSKNMNEWIKPIQDRPFRGYSQMKREGWGAKNSLLKFRYTYPTITKRGIVIPHLKKIQKIYKSRHQIYKWRHQINFFRNSNVIVNVVTWPKFGKSFYERSSRIFNFARIWPEKQIFKEWSWFEFNNFSPVPAMVLKIYSVLKWLKLKDRKFCSQNLAFGEVTREKLVGGLCAPSLSPPTVENCL